VKIGMPIAAVIVSVSQECFHRRVAIVTGEDTAKVGTAAALAFAFENLVCWLDVSFDTLRFSLKMLLTLANAC